MFRIVKTDIWLIRGRLIISPFVKSNFELEQGLFFSQIDPQSLNDTVSNLESVLKINSSQNIAAKSSNSINNQVNAFLELKLLPDATQKHF